MTKTAIERAIAVAGGLTALGESVGVTAQAVWRWKVRGVIPVDRVIAVEMATGIPREKLRPDTFGAPRPRPRMRTANAAA